MPCKEQPDQIALHGHSPHLIYSAWLEEPLSLFFFFDVPPAPHVACLAPSGETILKSPVCTTFNTDNIGFAFSLKNTSLPLIIFDFISRANPLLDA